MQRQELKLNTVKMLDGNYLCFKYYFSVCLCVFSRVYLYLIQHFYGNNNKALLELEKIWENCAKLCDKTYKWDDTVWQFFFGGGGWFWVLFVLVPFFFTAVPSAFRRSDKSAKGNKHTTSSGNGVVSCSHVFTTTVRHSLSHAVRWQIVFDKINYQKCSYNKSFVTFVSGSRTHIQIFIFIKTDLQCWFNHSGVFSPF